MALQRVSFTKKEKTFFQIDGIYLGIDFGTSFTKVSYSYSSGTATVKQVFTIDWTSGVDKYYLPTVVYIQNNRLYFDKPEGDYDEVKYFKYSIVSSDLVNNRAETKNSFEELCCVFFLTHVISRSLNYIKGKLQLETIEDIPVFINMGVPLENFYEEKNAISKGLYEELLYKSVCLAGGAFIKVSFPKNQVLISNLDQTYTKMLDKEIKLRYKAKVFPELAAEILLYFNEPNIKPGVFTIVDVGGGTVDLAIFQKDKWFDRGYRLYCHDQIVLPLGAERLQRIITNENENRIANIFKEAFSHMFFETKDHDGIFFKDLPEIDLFFLGGGAKNKWYRTKIKETNQRLRGILVPEFNFDRNIEDFIQANENLVVKQQRLIISQMLANHPDYIENVKGYPNYYKQRLLDDKKQKPKSSAYSYKEQLEDIQNERYGG